MAEEEERRRREEMDRLRSEQDAEMERIRTEELMR
jgi:hypothetical protein